MKTEVYELLERIESMLNLIKDDFEKRKVEPVKKRWRAREVGAYYSTNAEGLVGKKIERNNDVDDHRYKSGNYFKTEEEAIKHREVTYARQRIFDALRDAEGIWVALWGNNKQRKYAGYYQHTRRRVEINLWSEAQYQEPQWYSSEPAWEAVIVSHKADLFLVWGIEE